MVTVGYPLGNPLGIVDVCFGVCFVLMLCYFLGIFLGGGNFVVYSLGYFKLFSRPTPIGGP